MQCVCVCVWSIYVQTEAHESGHELWRLRCQVSCSVPLRRPQPAESSCALCKSRPLLIARSPCQLYFSFSSSTVGSAALWEADVSSRGVAATSQHAAGFAGPCSSLHQADLYVSLLWPQFNRKLLRGQPNRGCQRTNEQMKQNQSNQGDFSVSNCMSSSLHDMHRHTPLSGELCS